VKLKEDIFSQLQFTGCSNILIKSPASPCMITALHMKNNTPDPTKGADFELGWSGLQFLSANLRVKEMLAKHNIGPYALEGTGYVSFTENLFDDFDASQITTTSESDKLAIIELITAMIGGTCHPKAGPKDLIIVELAGELAFPAGIAGMQVHIIVPVEEGTWLGMYQIHTAELEVASKYYAEINSIVSSKQSIAAALASDRTIN
jgi:hypothetical protein